MADTSLHVAITETRIEHVKNMLLMQIYRATTLNAQVNTSKTVLAVRSNTLKPCTQISK